MGTPFDNPEIAEAMRHAGIDHTPDLTQEVLTDLAPFLAAEGIDLSDPSTVHDAEELGAALARASEEHNLRRFTPVRAERDLALTVLVEFTEALDARAQSRAEMILDSVGPVATAGRPAVSHVIGAGLGLLDSWHSDPRLGATIGEVAVPPWPGPARRDAQELITQAGHAEAYDSLDRLVTRYGGLYVITATTLAVAATILTYTSRRNVPLLSAVDELFTHRCSPAPGRTTIVETYGAWLAESIDEESGNIDDELDLFTSVLRVTETAGLDIEDPGDVVELIDTILALPDRSVMGTALLTLRQYVNFQHLQDPAQWSEVREELDASIRAQNPEAAVIEEAIAPLNHVADGDLAAAMSRTPVVEAIPRLLEWIGRSRPVTARGNLRREDIEGAAGVLGLYAVGVASLPHPQHHGGRLPGGSPATTVHARSMREVPVLSQFWEALASTEVLAISRSRVRPGPAAGSLGERALLQQVLTVFVMETIVKRMERGTDVGLSLVQAVISHILHALDPDYHPSTVEDPDTYASWRGSATSLTELKELQYAGLLEFRGEEITVPEGLRGVLALGTAMAMTYFDTQVSLD